MEKARVAIIDLGTNTFNLLITEVVGGSYRILAESKYPAKLGEGGIHKATITEDAMSRGIEALTTHLITISEYQVDSIFCFATSAIRSAVNGAEFVRKVKQDLGLSIRVIPGDEEAQTIFDGIKQVVPLDNLYSLIMDIGGGSVEFIIANREGIAWKESYNIGTARILENFNYPDPIPNKDVQQIRDYINKELSSLYDAIKKYPIYKLVGSSGSFDTIAAMIAKREYPLLDISKITNFKIENEYFSDLYNQLREGDSHARRLIPGMDVSRVDSIVPACIMIKMIVAKIKPKELWQCSFSLKEGAIKQIINTEL